MAEKTDEENDPREERRVRMWCNTSKQEVLFRHISEAKVGNRAIEYTAPNNIALSLSIALTASAKAKEFYESVLKKMVSCPKRGHACYYMEHQKLYDYFEQVQISVIFAYTAVESFANTAIPVQFTYERLNNRGIREVLSKENIERWCSTAEKVEEVLPLVFGVVAPKKSSFWSDFKMLEELRNDIVHPKTTGKKMKITTDYVKRFFDVKVFSAVDSGRAVINHYCAGRPPLGYFPQMVGNEGPVDDVTGREDSFPSEHVRPIARSVSPTDGDSAQKP